MPATNKKVPLSTPKDTSSSNPPSRKRKMGAGETKFYAVRVGRKPGIYTSWDECEAQTKGYPGGATYKSFPTREDAQAFMEGRRPRSEPPRFYGVAVGQKPGVYTDWGEAQKQIVGFKGPKYQKFDTFAEAEAFVRTWRNVAASGGDTKALVKAPVKALVKAPPEVDEQPPAKKAKKSAKLSTASDSEGAIVAYTDGSSRGNGSHGACAGVGVWFGSDNHPWNICERLPGLPQTNQRAELAAILRCLQVIPKDKRVEILSDSKYAIQCVTTWPAGWEKNDWKNDTVKNRDLIEKILALIRERDEINKDSTQFTWVKGHDGHLGNEAADRLAVGGSLLPMPKDDY